MNEYKTNELQTMW